MLAKKHFLSPSSPRKWKEKRFACNSVHWLVLSLNPCQIFLTTTTRIWSWLTAVTESDFLLLLDDDTDSRSRQQSNRAKGVLILLMNFWTIGFLIIHYSWFYWLHQFTVQLAVVFYFIFHCSSLHSLPCFCMLPILLCFIFQCSCILYVWVCLYAVR